MKHRQTIILAGITLLAMPCNASIMSLQEAKDRLSVVQRHEASSKLDYESAKHSYNAAKRARRAAQKEIKAIASANAKSLAAEQASLKYLERAHNYSGYVDEQYLGTGSINLRGYKNEYQ